MKSGKGTTVDDPPLDGALSRFEKLSIGAILALAMAVSTVTVPITSVLASFLIQDLGISRSGLGWLVTATTAVAAVVSPLAGRVADAFGGRNAMLAIHALGLASIAFIAIAPSYAVLVLAMLMAGLMNALGNPATNKVIVRQLPVGGRGFVMGVKQSGVQMGVFFGGVALPPLALTYSWRVAVALVAVAPVVGYMWTRSAVKADRPRKGHVAQTRFRHASSTRWIASYALVMGAGAGGIIAFIPLYAHEVVGMSVTSAGAAMSLLGLTGVVARILWARRSEKAISFASPLAILAGLAVLAAACMGLAESLGAALIWIGAATAGASVSAWNAVANLATVASVRREDAGRASGLVVFAFLGGFASTPVLFGHSVDVLGSYTPGWLVVGALFASGLVIAVMWRPRSARSQSVGVT